MDKKFMKNFPKPIDKPSKMCYNRRGKINFGGQIIC